MFKYWAMIRRAVIFQRDHAPDTPEHRKYWNDILGAVDILIANYYKMEDERSRPHA